MPELPEVETIRRQLEETLVGKRIKRIEVLRKKSLQGDPLRVEGKRITGVARKAKMLIITTALQSNRNTVALLIHLKMTGQLVYVGAKERVVGGHPTEDWVKELPSRHTRVILELDRGRLFFNDMRVFGWIKIISNEKLEMQIAKLPLDVVDKEFTVEYLEKILTGSRRAVKLILTDQRKLGGVGNIYANDGLFCAGIRPDRTGQGLKRTEMVRLYKCLRQVINEGIEHGGATASDDSYVNASGLGGKYQEHFLVYEREGQPCLRCKGTIRKIKLGGRGTYFCPRCQK